MYSRGFVATCISLALAISTPIHACGPYFPDGFVWQDSGELLLEMPAVHFYSELAFHYGTATPDVYDGEAAPPASTQLAVEATELAAALASRNVPGARVSEICWAYDQVRRATRQLHYTRQEDTLADGWFDPDPWTEPRRYTSAPQRFDWAVFKPLFAQLPVEFGLYAEGATYYHLGYMDEAIDRWDALLGLPESERPYRSVWAAQMLGKAHLIADPPAAIPYFERVRELVDAGFADSMGFYTASLGWQGRAEAQTGDFQQAIHHYVEQFQHGSQDERWTSHLSLDFACGRFLKSGPPSEAVLNDPLCREVITLWVLSGRAEYPAGNHWTDAMVAHPPSALVEAAGRLAHLYYQAGEMDLARQWVGLSSADDLAGQWVQSKLLLRDGKLAEADTLLAQLAARLAEPDAHAPRHVESYDKMPSVISAELGAVRLRENDYPGAMEAFLTAGYDDDAFYIADQVMNTDELASFIETHGEFFDRTETVMDEYAWNSRIPSTSLRYILARRYARDGAYAKASATYPEDLTAPQYSDTVVAAPLRDWMNQYAEALKRAQDNALGKDERATAYMAAARIARECGMELFGTEQDPDWAVFDGSLEPWGQTRAEAGSATAQEAKRVAEHAPTPNRRFHYRWIASDLMWEAAQLLPDNDERLAQALWYGGTWIETHDPEGADKFYKALVRRCRNLPLGKAADEKRWFPEKPESWDHTG